MPAPKGPERAVPCGALLLPAGNPLSYPEKSGSAAFRAAEPFLLLGFSGVRCYRGEAMEDMEDA
ncbi:MAG: hypothetical protein FJ225_06530 [Lentisphaerae bacterium]|nr:hypothetical protein [Lentisphaerota bacterium]